MSISNCPASVRRFLQHVGWQRSALSVARVVQLENRKNSSLSARVRAELKRKKRKEKRGEKISRSRSYERSETIWEIITSLQDWRVRVLARTPFVRNLAQTRASSSRESPLNFRDLARRSGADSRPRYTFSSLFRYLCLSRNPSRLHPVSSPFLRRKLCL